MSDELPPLPSDIHDLIAADRRADTLDDERRRRIARNVGAAIVAGGAVTIAVSATAKGGLLGAISAFFSRKGAIAVTAFAIGGATGAGGYAVSSKMASPPRPAAICPSVSVDPPSKPAPLPTWTPAPIVSVSASASASASAAPSVAPPAPSASTSELAAEKDPIETARSALLHGNPGNALAACAEHEKRFPKGKLVEEREYIAIASLVRLGRDAEARTRFASFKTRFPQSFYTASLEKELGQP